MRNIKKTVSVAVEVDAKIAAFESKAKDMKRIINGLDIGKQAAKGFESNFTSMFKKIEKLKDLTSGDTLNLIDEKATRKTIVEIDNLYSALLSKMKGEGIQTSLFEKDHQALSALKNLQVDYAKATRDTIKEQEKLNKAIETAKAKQVEKKSKPKEVLTDTAYSDKVAAVSRAELLVKKRAKEEKAAAEAANARLEKDPEYKTTKAKTFPQTKEGKGHRQATQELNDATAALAKSKAELEGVTSKSLLAEETEALAEGVSRAEAELQKFISTTKKADESAGFEDLKKNLLAIEGINWADFGIDPSSINSVEEFNTVVERLGEQSAERASDALEKLRGTGESGAAAMRTLKKDVNGAADAASDLGDREKEITRLRESMLSFFSIGNAVQLFKRAIKAAFNTVKELDAVMTETAVVTDFTVGDMWSQLPDYTQRANELGVSVRGAYEASTLYYQQGLATNQVLGVTSETLKMAKIAGLDYVQATDYMTAALRGFNMEVNETNAQRVSDVYSKLAAITASDTQEISVAMTKTASIAKSANMEFETTAAFLSQIIETTRESAETAGTAMKTVIARFQELKKDPKDIGLVDGEEVDANKIEKALRSINVALRDTSGQFRDLDDVFLEIAGKWQGLDTNTQRYIATMAAGSRQQSRFIAMMSDYERTVELIGEANNSAGASQGQFEKTLASLESQLEKLKNSWDRFTMGLANSEAIKFVVTILTGLLNTINGLTEGFGDLGGAMAKLVIAFNVFKGAQSLIKGKGLLGGFGKQAAKESKRAGDGAGAEFVEGLFSKVGDIKNGGFGSLLKENIQVEAGLDFSGTFENLNKAQKEALSQSELFKDAYMENIRLGDQDKISDIWDTEGAGSAIAKAKELGYEIKNTEKMSKAAGESSARSFKKTGMAIAGVGAIIQIVATSMESLGAPPEAVASIRAVGNALMVLPIIIGTVTAAVRALGITTKTFLGGPIIKTISLIIAALIAVIGVFAALHKTTKEKLADMEKTASEAKEAAEETNKAYEELFDTIEYQKGAEEALKSMIRGTQEWKDEVNALNDRIEETLGLYPELTKFVVRKGGVATLDTSSPEAKEVLKQIKKDKIETEMFSASADMGVRDLQSQVAFENLPKKIGKGRTKAQKDLLDNILLSIVDGDVTPASGQSMLEFIKAEVSLGTNMVINPTDADAAALINYGKQLSADKRASSKSLDSILDLAYDYNDFDQMSSKGAIEQINPSIMRDLMGKFIDEDTGLVDNPAMTTALQKLNVAFGDLSGGQEESLLNMLSEDGGLIDMATVKEYSALEAPAAIKKIEEDTGKTLTELADLFDMEEADFLTLIGDNFQKSSDRLRKERTDVVGAIGKIQSGGSYASYRKITRDLESYEEKFGSEFTSMLDSIFSKMEISGDQELVEAAYNSFMDAAKDGTIKDLQEIEDLVAQLDFSDPINTVALLNDTVENGSPTLQAYAKNLLEVGSASLGASAQMKAFINSVDYQQMREEIKDIVDETTELTAADILGLADQYGSLEKIIKQTGATAGGLAKALSKIEQGKMGFHQLTDSVMAALSAIDSVNSSITKTLKKISEFDAGSDEDDVATFISDASETISEKVAAGTYGNQQIDSYFDFLFGKEWDKSADGIELEGDAFKKKVEQLNTVLKQNSTNMYSSFATLAHGVDMYGESIGDKLGEVEVNLTSEGIELLNKGNLTTEELAKTLADAYGGTTQWAEMMIADLKNNSTDFRQEMNRLDSAEAIRRAMEAAPESKYQTSVRPSFAERKSGTYAKPQREVQSRRSVDESELLGLEEITGLPLEQIRADYAEANFIITDFYENGALKDVVQLSTELNEKFVAPDVDETWVTQFKTLKGEVGQAATSVFNLDAALAELEKQDITGDDAMAVLQQQIDEFRAENEGNPITIEFMAADGSILEFDATNATNFIEQHAATIAAADNKALADAIADSMGEVEIKFTASDESAKAVKDAIEGVGKEPVTFTLVPAIDPVAFAAAKTMVTDEQIMPIGLNTDVAEAGITTFLNFVQSKLDALTLPNLNEPRKSKAKHARGINNSSTSHFALMGEEGPELVQTDGSAYLIGQNGPETGYVNKGDTVYTAQETRKIMGAQPPVSFPRYATAYNNSVKTGAYPRAQTPKAINKVTDKAEEIKNSLDWLYNLVQDIDAELLVRDKIEREYNRLLKNRTATGLQLQEITLKEISSLERQKALEEEMLARRIQGMEDLLSKNASLAEYGTFNWQDMTIEIDWAKIDTISNKDTQSAVSEYISEMEKIQGFLQKAKDGIWKIDDQLSEIRRRGQDSYVDLESRVLDALLQEQEKLIEEMSSVAESVDNASSDIIDSLQKNIDKLRQDRDNERTEEDIAEKERRLAYLRQDTSGANALEIKQLEEELRDDREAFQDTLIDQAIADLQDQNDAAAEQRERQINLAQAQLDESEKTGFYANQATNILRDGFGPDGVMSEDSDLYRLLYESESADSMANATRENWKKDLGMAIKEGFIFQSYLDSTDFMALIEAEYARNGGVINDLIRELNDLREYKMALNPEYGKYGSYTTEQSLEDKLSNVMQKMQDEFLRSGGVITDELRRLNKVRNEKIARDPNSKETAYSDDALLAVLQAATGQAPSTATTPSTPTKEQSEIYIVKGGDTLSGIAARFGIPWEEFQLDNQNLFKKKYIHAGDSVKIRKYKKGGLADFTGPAWLDGSKSAPELVLNAKDTENFIQLKNMLSGMQNLPQKSNEGGTAYFDINIEVGEMGEDYDVEQMADKIKQIIYTDTTYRNVNTINLLR